MKTKILIGLLMLVVQISEAQQLRLRGRKLILTGQAGSGPKLSFLGSATVAEGTSQTYQLVLTYPNSTTLDVTSVASFTCSRGTANGLTVSKSNIISLASATNGVKGDDRITTLRASHAGFTAVREIILKDATVTATQTLPRMVTSADIAKFPQMKLGDYLVGGPNFVGADHSIQIRTSQKNAPTLSPGSTVWIKGGDYINVVLQLDSARTTDAQAPIRIKNYDGQVKVLNTFQLLGAQGAVISGRYDASTGEGDSDYMGHAGDYSVRSGRYGFRFSNRWTDSTKNGLDMDGGCWRVEAEFLEAGDGYFSAVHCNAKNYDMRITGSTVSLPYRRMKFHDNYVHDTESEGFYLGNTGTGVYAKFDSLELYNNVVVRAGTEAIQIGQLQKGSKVYNNVAMGNLNAKNAFRDFQDNNLQTDLRQGGHLFQRNLFIRGGEKFLNGVSQLSDDPARPTTSADTVIFRRNAWLYNEGIYETYYNTTTGGTAIPNLTIAFDGNWFGKNRFIYDLIYPSKPLETFLMKFDLKGANNQVFIRNNTFDGSVSKTVWSSNSNPTTTSITESGNNLAGTVPHPEFENFMGLPAGYDYTKVEFWTDRIGNSSMFPSAGTAKGTLVTVPIGEIRMYHGIVYESKAANNTAIRPGYHPNWRDYWNVIYYNLTTGDIVRNPTDLTNLSSTPPDKMKLKAGSFFAQQGLGSSF